MKLQTQILRTVLVGIFLLVLLFPLYGENESLIYEQARQKQVNQESKASISSASPLEVKMTTSTAGHMGMGGGGMGMGGGMMGGYGGGMAIPSAAESSFVLIIPSRQQDPQAIAEIMEDGKIMSQIIRDSIPPAQAQSPFKGYIGNALYGVFNGFASQISCLYIEQYGMIFVRQVDYPLLPSGKPEAQVQQDKDVDKVWQKAKRTVQGQAVLDENTENAQPSYNQARVEQLKQSLIGSLKHASNIRRLKPDDYIVIAIRYCPPSRRDTPPKRPVLLDLSLESQPTESTIPSSSSMIIRAAKKDIDQAADGKIDDTEFQTRVEVIVY